MRLDRHPPSAFSSPEAQHEPSWVLHGTLFALSEQSFYPAITRVYVTKSRGNGGRCRGRWTRRCGRDRDDAVCGAAKTRGWAEIGG